MKIKDNEEILIRIKNYVQEILTPIIVFFVIIGSTFFILSKFKLISLQSSDILDIRLKTIALLLIYIFVFSILLFFLSKRDLTDSSLIKKSPYSQIINKVALLIFFSLFIFPALVWIVLIILDYLSSNLYMVGSFDSWLSFFGSILAGILTVFSIVYAFNLQKLQRDLEIDRTQIPKFHFYPNLNFKEDAFEYTNDFIYKSNTSSILINMEFILKNNSSYVAANIEVIELYFETFDDFLLGLSADSKAEASRDYSEYLKTELSKVELILNGFSEKVRIPFDVEKKFTLNNKYSHRLTLILRYKSQFGKLSYTQKIQYRIRVLSLNNSLFSYRNVRGIATRNSYRIILTEELNNLRIE